MSLTLDLPEELENRLTTEAAEVGLTLSQYILRLISLRPSVSATPTTGVELVSYWQNAGVIGSRPAIVDSQQFARQLRHEAEERDRE